MAKSFDDYMTKLTSIWMMLSHYRISIGVVSNDAERSKEDGNELTNAQLLYIHEHGTIAYGGYTPARPVLDITLKYAQQTLLPKTLKKIEKGIMSGQWSIEQVELELQQMCMRLEDYARQVIGNNDGRLVRNAESTIKAKGFNHPLQKTGALKKAITCHLIKI